MEVIQTVNKYCWLIADFFILNILFLKLTSGDQIEGIYQETSLTLDIVIKVNQVYGT